MPLRSLTLRQLRQLNRKLTPVNLEAQPMRDPETGTYSARGIVSPKKLRKAWGDVEPDSYPERTLFKRSLLAALRNR